MRRLAIVAAIGLATLLVGEMANAQVVIGPGFGVGSSRSRLHDQLARREFQRQALRAAALRQGIAPGQLIALDRMLDEERLRDDQLHSELHFRPSRPPVVFLPPVSRASSDPFAGSPFDGNYYYWLSRQYAQGRVSKAEFNRQMYGVGRK